MSLLVKRKESEITTPDADDIYVPTKKSKNDDGSNPFLFPCEDDLEHIPKEFIKRRFYYISESITRNTRVYGVSKKYPPSNDDLLRYNLNSLPLNSTPHHA
jgi:hypothetical protein